jgi:ADP-heptose:LPS heptosyltransferase
VICSDGGGMHIAAALSKPIVCLFGDSSATHWHPWRVKYKLLKSSSNNVSDISTIDVVNSFKSIR